MRSLLRFLFALVVTLGDALPASASHDPHGVCIGMVSNQSGVMGGWRNANTKRVAEDM
jgi:hypothetical protein